MAALPDYARLILDGYSETPDFGVLRTEMDASVAKQRPRRSVPIVTREGSLLVIGLERRLDFDQWFAGDISGGAGWFDFRALDGQIKPGRIVSGQLRWTSPGGGVWVAQVRIETVG